jgi:hypothetical protein
VVLDPILPGHKRREKRTNTLAEMQSEHRSRTAVLAERLASARARSEKLPGAPLVREVLQNERELGGGLIAGGVAYRIFLWLVPFGLVVAAVLSFWRESDPDGLETAARRFGVGAAAAQAASEAVQISDRNVVLVLVFGLALLAWSRSAPFGRSSWPTHWPGNWSRRGSAGRSASSRSSTGSFSWPSSRRS